MKKRKYKLFFYMGKSFEALNQSDNALEAYQSAKSCATEKEQRKINEAIQQIKDKKTEH